MTTDFPALDGWRDLVRVANDADTFASAIRTSLTQTYDPAPARARVAGETWDAKADLILRAVNGLGLAYTPSQIRASWSDALRAAVVPKAAADRP